MSKSLNLLIKLYIENINDFYYYYYLILNIKNIIIYNNIKISIKIININILFI